MTPQIERTPAAILRDMIIERQRLLIREANYLRGLLGLPQVSTNKRQTSLDQFDSERYAAGQRRGSGPGSALEGGNEH